jgi:hypothetical protein
VAAGRRCSNAGCTGEPQVSCTCTLLHAGWCRVACAAGCCIQPSLHQQSRQRAQPQHSNCAGEAACT